MTSASAARDVVVPADAENQDNVDPGAEELQNDQSDSDGEEEPLVDFFADLEEITRNLGARGMRYIQRMEEVNLDNESADEVRMAFVRKSFVFIQKYFRILWRKKSAFFSKVD